MNKDAKQLTELLASIYDRCRDQVLVSPSWLAAEALQILDPLSTVPALIALAANLELRQLAREFCRQRSDEDDDPAPEQQELYPGLQRRYPAKRMAGEEPQYKLLEHLSGEDVFFNVARLRLEGDAKLKHADILEAWGRKHGG